MGLMKSVFGLKQSDEEWRELEGRYGGGEGPTMQEDGRRRSWGQYKKTRDQLVAQDNDE